MADLRTLVGTIACALVIGCGSSSSGDASPDASTSVDAGDGGGDDGAAACSTATCSGPGKSCRSGACVDDCRPSTAGACATGTVCDFSDGACKSAATACIPPTAFDACGMQQCGPGTACDGSGTCVLAASGCGGVECDSAHHCGGTSCVCDRPAASCAPAPLARMNQADFVGSLVNMANAEGAFDLEFDEICNAYAVTMISGPDYLRQLAPDGTLTSWTSTTNLNMGQVAVLRTQVGEARVIGDVAATYICCATCGCIETGMDGRLGVVHLDRTSTTRPLPNVLPATATTGTGPFHNTTLDTGPYALTWGADKNLYVGNAQTNGDFVHIDLSATPPTSSVVATFPSRVTAAATFDADRLLVATVGGPTFLFRASDKTMTLWATLPGDVTSIKRDTFTGRVYAEVSTTPPQILELSADGQTSTPFQTPPRLGRIAIAPDGWLYHVSVFPASNWMSGDTIVRFQLPAKR